jgi:hypothetical protein
MRRCAPNGDQFGGEAYQRGFHIVKQTGPRPRAGSGPGDEHIVTPFPSMKGGQDARRLAQAALGAVALDRAADPARGGEAQAQDIRAVLAVAGLDHHRAARTRQGFGGGEEIGPPAQAFDRRCGQAVRRLRPRARRRATIRRPLWVAMRERNPWRRLRTSRDG